MRQTIFFLKRFHFDKIVVTCLSSLLFYSCWNSETKNKITENPRIDTTKNVTIRDSEIVKKDTIPFLTDYKEEINIDTLFFVNGRQIKILHDTIYGKTYFLPKKYYSGEDTSIQKKIWFTKTKIYLKTLNGTADTSFSISNNILIKYFQNDNQQLGIYGVLLLNKDGIEITKDYLILNYSFSIPFTDLGKSVKISWRLTDYYQTINVDE